MNDLQSYIIRFKDSCSKEEIQRAMNDIKQKGGQIIHQHTLFNGFTAKVPKDHVGTFEEHPEVEAIEKDQEVHTQ